VRKGRRRNWRAEKVSLAGERRAAAAAGDEESVSVAVASIFAEVGDGAREPSGRIRAAAAVWFGRLHVDLLGEDEEGGLAEKRPARSDMVFGQM
jgi:hypothetical protein